MSIALPKSSRRKVRDQILDRLTAKGTDLARVIKTWQLNRGEDGEMTDWTFNMLPALSFTMLGAPASPSNELQTTSPIICEIRVGVKGTDQGDLFDLWAAVEERFLPGDLTVLKQLNQLDVSAVTLTIPAISTETFGESKQTATIGTGRLKILHHINRV